MTNAIAELLADILQTHTSAMLLLRRLLDTEVCQLHSMLDFEGVAPLEITENADG